MALTIAIEGTGVIANASSTTESIGTGTNTWNENGGGTDSWSTDTYLQGGESFAGAYSNKSGFQYYQTSTTYDFTPSTGTQAGEYIWIWINCPTIGLLETIANKGLAIRIGTDQTNYNDYTIAGSNDSNGWLGDWKCFVIDPTKTATATGGSGLTISSINYIGVWIDTAAIAKGDNIFIDQIAIGTGLRITGTSTTGWSDVVSYCTDYTNRAWGMFSEKEGIYYSQGTTYIGDSTQTAAAVWGASPSEYGLPASANTFGHLLGKPMGICTSTTLTTTQFSTDRAEADNFWSPKLFVQFTGNVTSSLAGFTGKINTYLNSGGLFTIDDTMPTAPAAGDSFYIINE